MQISNNDVQAIAEALSNITGDEATIHTSYSGRGMFGDTCLGFSGDFDEVALGVAIALGAPDIAESLAESVCTDSLGMGVIAYFPRVNVAGAA